MGGGGGGGGDLPPVRQGEISPHLIRVDFWTFSLNIIELCLTTSKWNVGE